MSKTSINKFLQCAVNFKMQWTFVNHGSRWALSYLFLLLHSWCYYPASNHNHLSSEFPQYFLPSFWIFTFVFSNPFFFFFLYCSHSIVSEVEHCYHFASNSFNVFIFREKLKLFVIPSDYISLLCFCLLSVFISYTPYSRDIEFMSFP